MTLEYVEALVVLDTDVGGFDSACEDVRGAEWRLVCVHLDAELTGQGPLRVDVDSEDAPAEVRSCGSEVFGGGGLAHPAFLLSDGDDHGSSFGRSAISPA